MSRPDPTGRNRDVYMSVPSLQQLGLAGRIELQELRCVLGCDDDTLRPNCLPAGFYNNVKQGLA